mgnify:CR=1 FL=1
MRKVMLTNLDVGDRLATDIRIESSLPDVQYRVRIDRGTELKSRHINRLREEGIRSIFIQDPNTSDLNEYFEDQDLQQAEEETIEQLQQTAETIRDGEVTQIPSQELKKSIEELIEILQESNASLAYTSLKRHSNYLAQHGFEVGKLSIYFALSHRERLYELYQQENPGSDRSAKEMINELGLGAVLLDMGNWEIPAPTLEKSESLTTIEWEAIRQHPQLGFEILQEIDRMSREACLPALLHHERHGGQGYPEGKRSKNIHLFGRITAIIDVYCALTTERPYRIELTPNRARQIMIKMQEDQLHFDPELFESFLELVPPYPIGQDVILSDGTRGVVSSLEEGFEYPTVRILYKGSEKIVSPEEIVVNREGTPDIVN